MGEGPRKHPTGTHRDPQGLRETTNVRATAVTPHHGPFVGLERLPVDLGLHAGGENSATHGMQQTRSDSENRDEFHPAACPEMNIHKSFH